jgi:hypothetical protein
LSAAENRTFLEQSRAIDSSFVCGFRLIPCEQSVMRHCIWKCALLIAIAFARPSLATIVYSVAGSTYSQNFDSLAASSELHEWTNDSTIAGWHLFRVAAGNDPTPTPMSFYDASDGSTNNGRFHSYGLTSDRALGSVGNSAFGYPGDRATSIPIGQPAGWMAASVSNNTGTQLTGFTLNYDGEQWSDGGNETPVAQTMDFQYGFGADFSSVSSWILPGGNFSFTSPVFTTTAATLDGNGAGRVANRGGTVTNLTWQPGTTLWFRWVERNDFAADHSLAIDNLSFSANAGISAVPEASTVLFGAAICVTLGGAALMRRAKRLATREAASE